jgi:hypothetical protein
MRYPVSRSAAALVRCAGLALTTTALAACGASAPPPAAPPAKHVVKAEPPPASLPAGHLARADVDAVLRQGPPWLLRRVRTEEVLRDNKFVGWRILELPEQWSKIDLKPGDIVTHVNGITLEHPDGDFFSAWTSLAVASDLRIAYERDGAQREVVFHIDGEPGDPPAAAREDAPPPAKAAPNGPPRKTIVIVGDEPSPPSD